MNDYRAPKGQQLGRTNLLGYIETVGDLVRHLSELNPDLPVYSGKSKNLGIALHYHAFIDPKDDYVSYTQVVHLDGKSNP